MVGKRVGLIWSDPVNPAESTGLFLLLSLFLLLPEDRASSSLGRFERRLISLIFAGRNRIIMIRRELPLTVIASPGPEPVASGQAGILLRACSGCCWLGVLRGIGWRVFIKELFLFSLYLESFCFCSCQAAVRWLTVVSALVPIARTDPSSSTSNCRQ